MSYDSDMKSIAKSRRQFERRKRSETQAIDEEYERGIQIAQVGLRDRIENLSKLYTKEENERASEIIEARRRIYQLDHRLFQARLAAKREVEAFKKKCETRKSSLHNRIQDLLSGSREHEIAEKITDTENRLESHFRELVAHWDQKVAALQANHRLIFDQIQTETKTLQQLLDEEESTFTQLVDRVGVHASELEKETQNQIELIVNNDLKETQWKNVKHEQAKAALEACIDAARTLYQKRASELRSERIETLRKCLAGWNTSKVQRTNIDFAAEHPRLDNLIGKLVQRLQTVLSSRTFDFSSLRNNPGFNDRDRKLSKARELLNTVFRRHYEALKPSSERESPAARAPRNSARSESVNPAKGRATTSYDAFRSPYLVTPHLLTA
jgi:hypothetical protein